MARLLMGSLALWTLVTACERKPSTSPAKPEEKPEPLVATTTSRETKLQQFAEKSGTVLVRGFSDVGSVFSGDGGYIHVVAGEYTVVNTGEKQRGIVVRVQSTDPERADESIVDYDEIDSLTKGIDYIEKVQKSVTRLDAFEAMYVTKSGLVVAKGGNEQRVGARISTGGALPAQVVLEVSKLSELKELLAKAKARLDHAAGAGPAT